MTKKKVAPEASDAAASAANKQIAMSLQALANEKDMPLEVVVDAMKKALGTVAAKQFGSEAHVDVEIDLSAGIFSYFLEREVVEDAEAEERAEEGSVIGVSDAKAIEPSLEIGAVLREEKTVDTGRIVAYQAGQLMSRFFKDAGRSKAAVQYRKRVGELIASQVKRVTRDMVIIDMSDGTEGAVMRSHLIPREIFRVGDLIKAVIVDVDPEGRGPLVQLSRIAPDMLSQLLQVEVPEIMDGTVEIRAVARIPGVRAKIAVKAMDARVDAVGACVGMRGARVQAVSSELNGERIDVINWDDNPAHLVISAMSPAEIKSLVVDEDKHSMDIIVEEAFLSQAIGREGQNVKLASELTGWKLNVMTDEEAKEKTAEQAGRVQKTFVEHLDIDEDIADILIREGLLSLDDIANAKLKTLSDIEEFDRDIAEELQSRAKSAVLMQAMSGSVSAADREPAQDLLDLPKMTQQLAYRLAAKGVVTRDDLADQSVDELLALEGMTREQASDLIMEARAHWFEDK